MAGEGALLKDIAEEFQCHPKTVARALKGEAA
jgi:hypothetical protein